MEKLFNPYDKEYMRMAMLKHEKTFREQVYELHRLYRIQKMLMKNIESSTMSNKQNQERWNSSNILTFSIRTSHLHDIQQESKIKLELDHRVESNNNNRVYEIIEESEIELTLGPSKYNRKKIAGTPPYSDSGHSFSSSSTGSSQANKTSLGTNQKTDKTREVLRGCQAGLVRVPETTSGCQSGSKNGTSDEQMRRDKIDDRVWLLQPLSLNMT